MIEIPNEHLQLDYKRDELPQIAFDKRPELFVWLQKSNVVVHEDKVVPTKFLIPSQCQINKTKVKQLKDVVQNSGELPKPVLISRDFYIIDGHHRVVAEHNYSKMQMITATMIELDIEHAIRVLHQFEESFTKTINEEREKPLNKPFRTPNGPKKFSVYVKNDKGNVVKVNFGDPDMSIKRDDPEAKKAYRARHKCDTDPGPKWKANYWSCKFWSDKSVTDLLK